MLVVQVLQVLQVVRVVHPDVAQFIACFRS